MKLKLKPFKHDITSKTVQLVLAATRDNNGIPVYGSSKAICFSSLRQLYIYRDGVIEQVCGIYEPTT